MLNPDFRDLLSAFADCGVEYLLVGAHALSAHGIVRSTGVSGVGFEEAWANRMDVVVEGIRVPVIGRTQLIANKRASGRPQDLVDADRLEGPADD